MELQGKIINFLGDSITEGHGTSGAEYIFFNRIAAECGLNRANGYGIGGTRIAKQHTQSDDIIYDKWFASRIDEMDDDADAVIVFGGTNDYGHGDAPIGKFSDRTPETFYGACHDLYTRLINKYPGKPIIVMTPLHRADESDIHEKGEERTPTTLKTYVDIIREVAEYYSLPVCDLFAGSLMQPKVDIVRESFVPDGLHPNDAGHALIAEKLIGFLKML